MTISEKEKLVKTWPFPYPEYQALLAWSRDQQLKRPGCTEENKREIEAEYEQKLNRMCPER
jgi:hypothetical protein